MDRRSVLLLITCAMIAGCGGDPTTPDTGTPPGADTSVPPVDTGMDRTDTGVPIDVGPVPDTGPLPDVGPVDTGPPGPDTDMPVDGGPPAPDCLETIGPAGGVLTCGEMTLTVPASALSSPTLISARRLAAGTAPLGLDPAFCAAGWELGPDGLAFAVPAQFVWAPSGADLDAFRDGAGWLNAQVDLASGGVVEAVATRFDVFSDGTAEISAPIAHFSELVVTKSMRFGQRDGEYVYIPVRSTLVVDPPRPNIEIGEYWRGSASAEHLNPVLEASPDLIQDALGALAALPPPFTGTTVMPIADGERVTREGTAVHPDGATTPVTASPAPVWYCEYSGRAGRAALGFAYEPLRDSPPVVLALHSADVNCVGPRKADSIMLATYTTVSQSFGSFAARGAAGAAANVIHASSAVTSRFAESGGDSTRYEGVLFTSERGLDSLRLRTGAQDITATYAAGSSTYDITGLVAGPVFGVAPGEALVVSGPGGTPSVSVPAPAPLTVARLFGRPNGLRTELRVPDGSFDALFVQILASGSAMAGDAGMFRTIYPSEMTLRGPDRVTTILTDAQIADLSGRGLTADIVRVGVYRQTVTTDFFPTSPRVVPVQAGHVFEIAAADLVPQPSPCDARPTGTTCTAGPNYRLIVAHEFGVEAFDPSTGALVGDVIPRPSSSFVPRSFHGVTQGPDNCLWVTDRQVDVPGVYRYHPDGRPVEMTPYLGAATLPSFSPLFIHEVGSEVWMSSAGRIEAFRPDGTHARTVVDATGMSIFVNDFLRLSGGDIVAATGSSLLRFPAGGGAHATIRSDRNTIDQITLDGTGRLVIAEAGTARRQAIEVALDGTLGRSVAYTSPQNTRGVAVLGDGRWLVTGRSLVVAVADPATRTSSSVVSGAAIYRYAGFACLP